MPPDRSRNLRFSLRLGSESCRERREILFANGAWRAGGPLCTGRPFHRNERERKSRNAPFGPAEAPGMQRAQMTGVGGITPLAEQWMGSERLWKLLVESPHFRGFIRILLAAFITADREGSIENRARAKGIRLAKRNFVSKEEILSKMKPMVLAEHHPAVMVILPHSNILRAIKMIGRGNW
jgi:hypothetical protein